jgi:hypothetical protein
MGQMEVNATERDGAGQVTRQCQRGGCGSLRELSGQPLREVAEE